MAEEDALKRLSVADPTLSRKDRMDIITEAIAGDVDLENDAAVTVAFEKHQGAINSRVKETRANAIGDTIAAMADEDKAGVVEGIKRMLGEKLNSDDLAVCRALPHSLPPSPKLTLTRVSADPHAPAVRLSSFRACLERIPPIPIASPLFLRFPLMYS